MSDLSLLLSEPLPRLLIFLVPVWVISRVRKLVPPRVPDCVRWVRDKGHNTVARALELVLGILITLGELGYALCSVVIVFSVLELAMPPLLQIVKTYRNQMLDFIMILVTASSVLLVYTSTTEETLRRHDVVRAGEKLNTIRRAKAFGLLCVILSVGAPLANPFWPSAEEYMLALGVLAFIAEALLALHLGV